jgi:hypothetical protein
MMTPTLLKSQTRLKQTLIYSVCFTDISKQNLTMVVLFKAFFKLEPIFATAPAASKNEACFKTSQN